MAGTLEVAIGITEDGKHKGYIGTALKGNGVIELTYQSNPEKGKPGHWGLADVSTPVTKSDEKTCLPDAALAALSEKRRQELGVHSSEDILIKLGEYRLADPEHALKSDLHYQRLVDLDPALGMQGTGVWAEAAKALKTVDDFVAQHPKLAGLLLNSGTIAGGAMWLKNLTPAGLASYLLANHGYNKIMKIAGGSIEKGKKNLAKFFVKHDKEITPEQADYLANFTMTLLTDVGGRMVFHQVAAKGFNKVRGVKGTAKATKFAKQGIVHIGDKLKYLFGKAKGRPHNVQRSVAMQRSLESVGIFDTPAGREHVAKHLVSAFEDSKNVKSIIDGFCTKESLLMGPRGGVLVESVWKDGELISAILKN